MNYNRDDQNQLLTDFTATLGEEVSLYGELEKVLKTKQTAIIGGEVEELQDTIHLEHGVVQKIRRSTHKREELADLISKNFRLEGQNPPLRDIMKLAPTQTRMILSELQSKLKGNLSNIDTYNRENEYLLNSSVETIRGLIQILLSTGGESEMFYNGRGSVANTNDTHLSVDCQV